MCNRKWRNFSVALVAFLICIREVHVSNLGQRTGHWDWGYLWYTELCLTVGFGIGVGPSCWLLLRNERGVKSLAGKTFLLNGLYATVVNVKHWLNIPTDIPKYIKTTWQHRIRTIFLNDHCCSKSKPQIPSILTGIGPVLTFQNFRHRILNAYYKFVYYRHQTVNFLQNIEF